MRKYGKISAILTILDFGRLSLKAKERVKQGEIVVRFHEWNERMWSNELISDDLESFYQSTKSGFESKLFTSIPGTTTPMEQYLEGVPKEETANIFLTQQLTEEELRLLKSRNNDYLNMFYWYRPDVKRSIDFVNDIEEIGRSSDPEVIFSHSVGNRWTLAVDFSK